MPDKYSPLQQYLRDLPVNQEEVTLTFELLEQILNDTLPPSAYQEGEWWGNQKQGTQVETLAWMEAGWMVDTVDLHAKRVHFVRQ